MKRETGRIEIRCGGGRGSLLLGPDALSRLAPLAAGRPAAAVIDSRVWRLHRRVLDAAAGTSLPPTAGIRVAGGENAKTPAELERVWRFLLRRKLPRDGVVIGIGGGAVLDLAGMAASTWGRGVEFACVPTTLLAMADAAVGGKTGLNIDGVKNPVGTFHAAGTILVDPSFLDTLPRREIRNGMAEVIKAAVIGSPWLFRELEDDSPRLSELLGRGPAAGRIPNARAAFPWDRWIGAAVRVKSRIVAVDYRERGRRRALNLGHTLGHALEPMLGIGHGEAVALGMAAAARIAAGRGLCSGKARDRIIALLTACGLPAAAEPPPAGRVSRLIERDKKTGAGNVRWVLPLRIGAVDIEQEVEVREALAALRG